MIVNQSALGDLYTGFVSAFQIGMGMATPGWEAVATRVPSSGRTNQYNWVGSWPKLREWAGDRVVNNLKAHGYTITNKTWETTVEVDREDIEDDLYGSYTPLFQAMGQAVATHPDETLWDMVKLGNSELAYDGQFYFDTDHPMGSGTKSNWGGGGGDLWILADLSKPLKPFIMQMRREPSLVALTNPSDEGPAFRRNKFEYGADMRFNVGFGFWQMAYGSKDTLNTTNYEAAYTALLTMEDDHGRRLGIRPTHLIFGPSNRKAAHDLLSADRLASGASNTNAGIAEPMLVGYL